MNLTEYQNSMKISKLKATYAFIKKKIALMPSILYVIFAGIVKIKFAQLKIAHQFVSNRKKKLGSIRKYKSIVMIVLAKPKGIQMMISIFKNNSLNL